MDYHALIDEGQAWLQKSYPGYFAKPGKERRVLAVAWLCDVKKPRESTGNNDGELVEAIQAAGGGSKGQSWCAYAQNFCAIVATMVWRPTEPGAVLSWKNQGRNEGKSIPLSQVGRGDLLIRDPGDGHHHIGCCLFRLGPVVHSIEGNTSPGDQGSQGNGEGMYRRTRLASFWTDAIKGD